MKLRTERISSVVTLDIGPGDDGALPTRFRLFAIGSNDTSKGPVVCDPDGMAACAADLAKRGMAKLPIDYGHGMLFGLGDDANKAAGWFTPEFADDGVYASDVEWTPLAAQRLRDREYRFYSPAIEREHESGRMVGLINCALTNLPATLRQQPLVASDTDHGQPNNGVTMDPELTALLALTKCADTKALHALVAKQLEMLSAAQARETTLAAKVQELETAHESSKRDALIASLSSAGKLAPALHDWARKLPLAQLEAFAAAAPAVTQAPVTTPAPTTTEAATDVEKHVFSLLGISAKETK